MFQVFLHSAITKSCQGTLHVTAGVDHALTNLYVSTKYSVLETKLFISECLLP